MGKSKWDTYTNDDLLDMIKKLTLHLNRPPFVKELTKYSLPNKEVYDKRFNTKKWNDILCLCGFKTEENKNSYRDKNWKIQILKYYSENNKLPTANEWTRIGYKPDVNWLIRKFGGWDLALFKAGLIKEKPLSQDERLKISIVELKELSKNLNRFPKVLEYEEYRKNGYARTKLELKLNMKFSEICKKYIPKNINVIYEDLDKIHKTNVDKKQKVIDDRIVVSIENLKYLFDTLKRYPNVDEYDLHKNGSYYHTELEYYLNMTYSEICKKYLETKTSRQHNVSDKDLIDNFTEVKNKLQRIPTLDELSEHGEYQKTVYYRKFGGYINFLSQLSLPYYRKIPLYYNDKELLDLYLKYSIENNRSLTYTDIYNNEKIPCPNVFSARFGSIENICNILNLEYNIESGGYGNICRDLKGCMCRSIAEQNITNFFINNNIKYEKETPYKNKIKDFNMNYRFDWTINIKQNEYNVEYFGMYNAKSKSKTIKNYVKKAKKKIKLLYKHELINQCIFIFPNDIKPKAEDGIKNKLNRIMN